MDYCILSADGVIENIIVCGDGRTAETFGAVPSYPGAKIGGAYAPKTPAQLREEAYNTEPIIVWDGESITVTEAAQLWNYYAAEGSDKAESLQILIAAAKAEIREKYPDEEVV